MSTIPTRLSDWTFEALKALTEAGVGESDTHDFKAEFNKAPDNATKITKLCCAFANTRGGFVVVGVKQKDGQFLLEGIEPSPERYGEFLKKVRVEPDIKIEQPNRIDLETGKAIYVFEIPDSRAKPHLPSREEDRVFWKRVGSDCKQMPLSDVRSQMRDFEYQRQRLTLLLMDIHFKMEDIKENNMARYIKRRCPQVLSTFEFAPAVGFAEIGVGASVGGRRGAAH